MRNDYPLSEFQERQQNVMPTQTIRNATFVDAFLARSGVQFTGAQRAGAFVLGGFYFLAGTFWLAEMIRIRFFLGIPIGVLFLFLGIKTLINAMTAPTAPKHKHFPAE